MKEPPRAPEEASASASMVQPPPRHRRTRPLTVQIQYLGIDGADGEVLQDHQIEVIRAALRWLVEHPDDDR